MALNKIYLVQPISQDNFLKNSWQSDIFKDKSIYFNAHGVGKRLVSLVGRSELSEKKVM